MVTAHYAYFAPTVSWHTVIDDYGNELRLEDLPQPRRVYAWRNAYRFANGQSFEQAQMRSIGCLVTEH